MFSLLTHTLIPQSLTHTPVDFPPSNGAFPRSHPSLLRPLLFLPPSQIQGLIQLLEIYKPQTGIALGQLLTAAGAAAESAVLLRRRSPFAHNE